MPELRDIYLHGDLGRRFGRRYRLAVRTPAEAVRALCVQLGGLREVLRTGRWRVVVGARMRRRACDEESLRAGFDRSLHLVPVVAGTGGGKTLGIGLTIAGAALLVAAFAAPLLLPAALAGGTTIFGVSTTTVGLVGAALALQGVSILLAPKPRLDGGQVTASGDDQNLDSFLFGGLPDRPIAGRPVPVTFGTYRVPGILISFQLKNVRLA